MSRNRYVTSRQNGKKNYVHRQVMEEHLGRTLMSHEHVYHKDGDSTNNEISNLVLIVKKYLGS